MEKFEQKVITLDQLRLKIGQLAAVSVMTISGPSGSGKSTLSSRLASDFPDSTIIHTDDYYIGKTRMATQMPPGEELNFDHPAAIDIAQIARHLVALKNGTPVLGARYDMLTSEPTEPELLEPAPLIIVEGLVANHQNLRAISELSVLAQSSPAARLQRRITRDQTRKSYNAATTSRNFHATVEPSYQKYYAADDAKAEYVIARREFDKST